MSPGLSPALMRPGAALLGAWVFSPRVSWEVQRRRLDAAGRFPGPPRGTAVRALTVGGVPCEELRPPHAGDDTRLVYLHGGGYVTGSPRSHRSLVGRMAAAFGAPALSVDYRLAPEHPYPAALGDALAVFSELTAAGGLAPERVVIAGDSAGAGLALAVALSLRDAGRPLPAALGLIAPWLDLAADAGGVRGPSRDVMLKRGLLRAFASAYLSGGGSPRDPRVSPLYAELAGLPPLVVHTTGDDLLRADGLTLVERARGAGLDVVSEDIPGLWHDAHVSAALLAEPGGGAPLRMAGALRAFSRSRPPAPH